LGAIALVSCSKGLVVIDGNVPFSTVSISDIKIENYVNRLYIDLIGREPIDDELIAQVDRLKTGSLSREVRDSIIVKLMTDTTFRANEFSYKTAYIQNLYNLAKVRCIEGAPDSEIERQIGILRNSALQDSLEGEWDLFYRKKDQIRRNENALASRQALYDGLIVYHQLYGFMIDNSVYDEININTFNFIRATFDQLIWRLPTLQEFDRSFNMIQANQTDELFGVLGSNKYDYVRILTESQEMQEGLIIWCYQVMLSRSPSAGEIATLLPTYLATKNIDWVIAQILVTDEYANFN
jgi:hypothetical protein